MKKISIVGFGRFGKTLYRLLKEDFSITIFQRKPLTQEEKKLLNTTTVVVDNLQEVYKNEVVFFAVPISSFASVIKTHKKYFRKDQLLIDVLSVKVHPKKIFEKYLKKSPTRFLLTHPMFGPDSSKDGFQGLPLILSHGTEDPKDYEFWKKFFEEKRLQVVELSSEEHDKLAANSQGLTHFIGRLLERMHVKKGPIDSLGTQKLLEIKEQTCNDTWQLFTDLQTHNPYTKHMRISLGKAYNSLFQQLLPKRVNQKKIVFGIQGGKGSFNEQALQKYLEEKSITSVKVVYLYTTEKVLKNLYTGNIDFGLFAISNSTGGLVDESLQAMGKYLFSIKEDFSIPIHHVLMKRKDATINEITTIMGHPQTFIQCKENLAKQFSSLLQKIGEGDMIDTAKIAKSLATGKLPKSVAILGPEILSQIYDFDIIEKKLQDRKDNQTRFLLVTR